MKAWRIPSSTGDFSLEKLEGDDGKSLLVVENPTADEQTKLRTFLAHCREKRWVDDLAGVALKGRSEIQIDAPLRNCGPVLAADAMPARGALTAVLSKDGTLMCTADDTQPAEVADAVQDPKAEVATTVRRPTTCCPNNPAIEGPLKRSSRLLREFCTKRQWRSWVDQGHLDCVGGLTGHTYRLYHRNHPSAVDNTKICVDLETRVVLHFWDWTVPPAEEVLAAMLILEHREPWLRNEATYLGWATASRWKGEHHIFANPLGTFWDGTWDAMFFRNVGANLGGLK